MNDCLEGRIVSITQTTDSQKKEMFSLLTTNFEGYTISNFENDLSQKDNLILLENSVGEVKGFTTIQNLKVEFENTTIRGIFSGDTIVDPNYWNKHDMFNQWIRYALQKKEESSDPLYWFLICSGCRTYKIMSTFFKDFYPAFDKEDSPRQKNILDLFAKQKFGNDYDSTSGLIIFSNSEERLKMELAKIDETKLKNPTVAYFLKRNPNYYLGHELACISEISEANLSPLGKRLIK